MNPLLRNVLFVLGALTAIGLVVMFYRRYRANKSFAENYPEVGDRKAATESLLGDITSLRAMREVLIPSAQDVAYNVNQTDLNPIGGTLVGLKRVNRFSPLNN